MKKVAILTQPLNVNYGGLLQAFALQRILLSLGISSDIINYSPTATNTKSYSITNLRKTFFFYLKFLLGKPTYGYDLPSYWLKKIYAPFIVGHISMTKFCPPNKINLLRSHYDRWIVGSDQIWRLRYTSFLAKSIIFLNFLSEEERKRSFSYAASFGTDEWEGSPEETEKYSLLLKQFKSVSVREHSGITICKKEFGVDAVQMPDPTLLLKTDDYEAITTKEKILPPERPYLAAYLLYSSTQHQPLLLSMGKRLHLPVQQLTPCATAKFRERFPISVAQWLCYIRNASYLITDSFHGCIFSIIFNIPFVCLGNNYQDVARFNTLLKIFGLENRLPTNHSINKIEEILSTPIDWEYVNNIHESERSRGIDFLKTQLEDY